MNNLTDLNKEHMEPTTKKLWYSQLHYEEYGRLLRGRLLNGTIVLYSFTFEDLKKGETSCWPDIINLGEGQPLN